ncbi:MAG: hypothetical protein ACK40L_02155 [Hydrogenophaga sp.]
MTTNTDTVDWAKPSLFEQLCYDTSSTVWHSCAEQWRHEQHKLQAKMRSADLSDPAQFEALQKIDEALGAAEWLLNALCRKEN